MRRVLARKILDFMFVFSTIDAPPSPQSMKFPVFSLLTPHKLSRQKLCGSVRPALGHRGEGKAGQPHPTACAKGGALLTVVKAANSLRCVGRFEQTVGSFPGLSHEPTSGLAVVVYEADLHMCDTGHVRVATYIRDGSGDAEAGGDLSPGVDQ
jgi:hypothetical protein